MLSREQLAALTPGDRLVRTNDGGERDTCTVEENDGLWVSVRWSDGQRGLIDTSVENPRFELLGGAQ